MGIADIIFLASVGAAFTLAITVMWHYQRSAMERAAAEHAAMLRAENEALRQAREAWRR